MRILLGILAGAVVAVLCVFVIEGIGHMVFPPPPGTDLSDPAQLARIMETIPAAALAFVWIAWFVGSLAGAFVANRIARRALAGWAVALLVLAGGVFTMTQIPHPAWMWALGILLPLLGGWLAQRLAKVPL